MNEKKSDVDLLSVALVREYLSRKGYKTTLNHFDKESMKRDDSIQNRRVLAEELGIIDHVKKNKERGEKALKSFLEMIVYYLLSLKDEPSDLNQRTVSCSNQRKNNGEVPNSINSTTKTSSFKNGIPQKDAIDFDLIPCANKTDITLSNSSTRLAKLALENEVSKGSSATVLCSRRKKLDHNNIMVQNAHSYVSPTRSKIDLSSQYLNSPRQSSRNNISRADPKHQRSEISPGKQKDELKMRSDLIMDDIDMTEDLNNVPVMDNYEEELIVQSEGITLDTAINLKVLILGSATTFFNAEWIQQGFKFSPHQFLKYGLVQDKGGPCGLLASVQAIVLKHLLFQSAADEKANEGVVPQPTPNEQLAVLVNALADILVLVSQKHSNIIITLPSHSSKFTPSNKYKNDKLTEKLLLYHMSCDHGQLRRFISKNISYFTNSNGCILLLYSAVLSCGIENIRNDMDEVDGKLIGSHGYCTQEMVNLLLTGKAVSNVFDGDVDLDSGAEHSVIILHGIKTRSDIGFLSLFEHYESCEVGDNYKNPNFPIWVVCSESHFSVLFSPVHVDNSGKTPFDLYYYDGLGRQDEEIRLTVTWKTFGKVASNTELIPPLEHCIRTKWKSATVSWNGTEPIL